MNLPFQITVNSVLMIIIGLGLMAFGIWMAIQPFSRIFGAGFFFTGVGNVIFGATNGFTDMTPVGRYLFRVAVIAYIIGVPIIAYYLYGELSFE